MQVLWQLVMEDKALGFALDAMDDSMRNASYDSGSTWSSSFSNDPFGL